MKQTMAETKSAYPVMGQWGKLPTKDVERFPKVVFEVNIPIEVTFKTDDPLELPSEVNQDGVYYVFEVLVDGKDMVIMTSAWTLIRALKIMSPLKNKRVKICKRLIKGKQQFEVIQITKI